MKTKKQSKTKKKKVTIEKNPIKIIEKPTIILSEIEKMVTISINGKVVRFYAYEKEDRINETKSKIYPHNADIQQLTEEENEILQEYMIDFDWSD